MSNFKRILSLLLTAAMLLTLLTSCGSKVKEKPDEEGWVATWASAQLAAGTNETPFNPALKENTVRQQIRVNIGGDKIRLTLSNQHGDIPATFESVHIAHLVSPDGNAIDTSTDTVVTFNGGSETVEIPNGETAVSDEIPFSFEALDDLAITMKLGKFAGATPTSHTGARCTTWIATGDHVSDESFTADGEMTSWYFISELDTWAPAGTKTVVLFGDSITDGYGSTPNKFERWSDELTRQLQANPDTKNITVANEGIGGNSVFGGLGPAGRDRFDRDVLNIAGARYMILLLGINDIGYASEDISDSMIEEYKIMIDKCHENGIRVYAGTILPVNGNGYYSDLHEQIRQKLNEWFRSSGSGFDGVIDFDELLRNPDDPTYLIPEYSNDNLHPSIAGYKKMGEFAYQRLTELWAEEK